MPEHYYSDKLASLADIFGTTAIALEAETLVVDQTRYPIIDDVIILVEPDEYTMQVRQRLQAKTTAQEAVALSGQAETGTFAEDIQYTFGEEWQKYSQVLAEHGQEFRQYFDLVDLSKLSDLRVCDLGCGSGRWSYHLKESCKELILVDFSDAIFVARANLAGADHCLFFMGDLTRLPFRDDFADFLFCLGVLHHLPTPCLDEVKKLTRFAPALLIYLYYALDNRPFYFRLILSLVTFLRRHLSRVRSPEFRKLFSHAGALFFYMPLILLGRMLQPLEISSHVPLYDTYYDKSLERIQQDVYDRFFTRIEQRVTRKEILGLRDSFEQITMSEQIPYWHFLCNR